MRASRLVSLLLLLQARRRCTADELADELRVSVRTIYRDLAELNAAGIPVYAVAGRGGGYGLVDGYQTRLTGLTAGEAEALLLIDLISPLGALGLGEELASARRKLAAAMPAAVRDRASSVAGWVHLDMSGWFSRAHLPTGLPHLAAAVLGQRRVRFDYPTAAARTLAQRIVEPLGLVLKGRSWYLVARHCGLGRPEVSYAVHRITRPEVMAESFTRPAGFHLAETWHRMTAEFEQGLPLVHVRVRVCPDAVERLRRVVDERSRAATDWAGSVDNDGWLVLDVGFERLEHAQQGLLGLGAAVQVLEPDQLRHDLVREVCRLAERYELKHFAERPAASAS